MTLELQPASSLPAEELAALFTRAYEGYTVPMQIDEEALRFLVRTFDLVLDAGLVAFDADEPVGLVNLGIRGERGWIGGLGVVALARRKGIGRTLMEAEHEQARARGVRELSLEVIEANDAAFRLYEELGYEMIRWLEIGSLEASTGEAPSQEEWGTGARAHPRLELGARAVAAGRRHAPPLRRPAGPCRHERRRRLSRHD